MESFPKKLADNIANHYKKYPNKEYSIDNIVYGDNSFTDEEKVEIFSSLPINSVVNAITAGKIKDSELLIKLVINLLNNGIEDLRENKKEKLLKYLESRNISIKL